MFPEKNLISLKFTFQREECLHLSEFVMHVWSDNQQRGMRWLRAFNLPVNDIGWLALMSCIILVNLPYLYICILIYEHINSGPRMPSMSILFDRRLSLCRWILSLFLCHIVLGKRNHSSYFICALSSRFAFFYYYYEFHVFLLLDSLSLAIVMIGFKSRNRNCYSA